ncbi:MAG: 50S ribosomal protein L4 [Clostridiales bacterium]|jgi:large subunit ribosomal protein L4|nr:50S ribosomal protein L4 [Clostridiales bacterium]
MASVDVYNMQGEQVDVIDLPDSIFGVEVNEHAVHMAVVQYLANQRQGTKSAKTRAEVRGGGRKPWRQKGTGRARQGSTRAPQWTGGGVVFAPKPRDFSIRLNKKQKRLALKSVLTSKVQDKKLIVLDALSLGEIKTKEMRKICDNLKLEKALVVIKGSDRNVILSARNIPDIKTAAVNTINVYDILKYDMFVVTKEAVEQMREVYA